MSREDVKYGQYAFEENTHLITWVQQFLIRLLSDDESRPHWTDELLDEWQINAQIDIYKYVFDEELLNAPEKIEWAKAFMTNAIEKAVSMSEYEFNVYTDCVVGSDELYDRVKIALKKIELMLDGKDPQSI